VNPPDAAGHAGYRASTPQRTNTSTARVNGVVDTTTTAPVDADRAVAKNDDDRPVQVDAAFVIEDWPWVVGFDQVGTDDHDDVSVPSERRETVTRRRGACASPGA